MKKKSIIRQCHNWTKRGVAMAMAALLIVSNGVAENGKTITTYAVAANEEEKKGYTKEILDDIAYLYEHNAYVPVEMNNQERLLFLNKNGIAYEEYNGDIYVYYTDKDCIMWRDYGVTLHKVNIINYIQKMAEYIGTGKGTISKEEKNGVYKYTMRVQSTDDIIDLYTYMIDEEYSGSVWNGILNLDVAEVYKDENYIEIQFNWSKDNKLTANCKSSINGTKEKNWCIDKYFELGDWDTGDWSNTDDFINLIEKLQESLTEAFEPVIKQIKEEEEKNILYTDSNNIQYNLLDNGTCTVWNVKNLSGNLTIPSKITYEGEGYIVSGINCSAFVECKDLTGVKIPASVKYVGEEAFSGCTNLENVEMADGVQKIESGAFLNCTKLKKLEIPSSVVELGDNICDADCCISCLEDSKAEEYAKKNKLKYTVISLPKTGDILTDTKNACKVKVIKGYAKGETVSYAGTTKSSATNVTIPNTVTIDNIKYKVVGIADKAFSGNKKIKKVTLGNTVTNIGKEAFKNCSKLQNIVIKADKVTVGSGALKGTQKSLLIKVPNKKVYQFKTYFKGKGNNKAVINSTGKPLPKKDLKQLGIPFDLKKNKAVDIKAIYTKKVGVKKITATVKSIKISKAKKGYKKAVIKVDWRQHLSNKDLSAIQQTIMDGNEGIGGYHYFTVVDKKTGQNLEEDNDYGVKVTQEGYSTYESCPGYGFRGSWDSDHQKYSSKITIIYPSDYKDLCFGVGGEQTKIDADTGNSYGNVGYEFWNGDVTFTKCILYKKNKKNCHFMNIK